jgi:Protein of unknown function (DUF3987)/CHC2 zinc finger
MDRFGLGMHAEKSARCPFHDDQHNSFSVWRDANGRWAWKCHAGCGAGDEINFLEVREQLSRRDAAKRFLDLAGVNGAMPRSTTTFKWQPCVDAFTDIKGLARWRGYKSRFVEWLKENGLIGIYDGRVATPVIQNSAVVGAHYRLKDASWRYFPSGINTRPLVIGDLLPSGTLHIFESQWDAFAFMDKSGVTDGIIITRGASNGGLVAGAIPEHSTVYLWPQNDGPGQKWERDICSNTKATMKRAKIPAPHKDLNQWTKAGGTSDGLFAAMVHAETIRAVEAFEGFETGQELEDENKDPFPLSSLPPLVEAMAKEVCATERVPESLAGCCALGILSASIGAGLEIQSAANRVTRGNVYVLASAESGSGKAETFRHMARPFQQFEIERVNAWREQDRADLVTRRTLVEVAIKKLKKKYAQACGDINAELKAYQLEVEELEKRLHAPILSCEDVTSEKLAILLSENDEQLASLSATHCRS